MRSEKFGLRDVEDLPGLLIFAAFCGLVALGLVVGFCAIDRSLRHPRRRAAGLAPLRRPPAGRSQDQNPSSASWSAGATQYSRHNPSERTVKAWASTTSNPRPSSRAAVARVNNAVW